MAADGETGDSTLRRHLPLRPLLQHHRQHLPPFQATWHIKPDLDAVRFILRLDFSAPPTSAECMVIATIYKHWLGRLFTLTLRRRQAAWRAAVYGDLKCTLLPHRLMVHHEGSYY